MTDETKAWLAERLGISTDDIDVMLQSPAAWFRKSAEGGLVLVDQPSAALYRAEVTSVKVGPAIGEEPRQ